MNRQENIDYYGLELSPNDNADSLERGNIGLIQRIYYRYEKYHTEKNIKKNIKRIRNLNEIDFKQESFRAYADYYKFLYVSNSVNIEKLKELLFLYGSPDFENPYPKDSLEYNFFHPYGFIASDIEAILIFNQLKMENKNNDFIIPILEDVIGDPVVNKDYNKKKEYYEQALLQLSYIFYYGDKFNIVKKKIHRDNIELAIIDIITQLNFEKTDFSKDDFAKKLNEKELFSYDNSLKLFRINSTIK